MIQRLTNIWAAVALVGVIAVAVGGLLLWSHGFDSRAEPSSVEENIAMKIHDSSIPDKYEKMNNPLATRVDLIEAGGHYEEHCAACHADNGSGQPKFHVSCIPGPRTFAPKILGTCRTARSIGSSRTVSAGLACRPLENPETTMNMLGRWSLMSGIYLS